MKFRVSGFPGQSLNPYLTLFYEALEPYGVVTAEPFVLSPRWLGAKQKEIDAIHFHWPEWLWSGRNEGSTRALAKLRLVLGMAGVLGIKRIWTVHNLEPHESVGWADRWGQRLLARHCDLLIVHSTLTAERVREQLRPRAPIVVMPHGNYKGYYPAPRARSTILSRLGIPSDRPIVCCIGWLRDYKGLDLACEVLDELGDKVRLVIAGPVHPSFDLPWLETQAELKSGLTLIARELSNQQFVDILAVSEAVLLPYQRITGSGVLLAALTHGRGVIASDIDYFREVLPKKSDAGRLFSAGDTDAAVSAIRAYLTVPHERREAAAQALAAHYDWERCVPPVGEVFREWLRERTFADTPDQLSTQP